MTQLKIGLALGSGSSRGWTHIGIIRALLDEGFEPDIVCGTSMGALVGASFVSGKLDELEKWAVALTKFETARMFEIKSSFNGFVNTRRLHDLFHEYVADNELMIESLEKKYACVATDLYSGREVWLDEGPILEAVWASISLPGLFPAVKKDKRWMVDGGLVNPVPVSVCRAFGADVVIAVNLNGDIVGRHSKKIKARPEKKSQDEKSEEVKNIENEGIVNKISNMMEGYTSNFFSKIEDHEKSPGLLDTIASSVNITQDRITKSRMAGDPPDIVISPHLSQIGLLELYRAEEAIEEGKKCVERMLPEIKRQIDA